MSKDLKPDKALIFRITHRDNVPWILDNGLHCQDSGMVDPNFVVIGNQELIEKRRHRDVPIPPGGTLSNYVPFYFTPYSPMMFNIKTGHGGIRQRRNDEIVIFVSSLYKLQELEIDFVYTDRHASLLAAEFSSDLEDLGRIDWEILQKRDFKKDPDDMEKMGRYMAEALIHQHVPINVLLGIGCYDSHIKGELVAEAAKRTLDLKIVDQPNWYFR
jgi:hypothetical protein